MGRHAVPDEQPPSAGPAPTPITYVFRGALAFAVGVTTALVTSWAGNPWGVAGIAALGAAAVVLLAAWIAGTVPGPPRTGHAPGPHRPADAPGPRRPHERGQP